MALCKDSNPNRCHLLSMMLTDRPGNTELFCKPVKSNLMLGPELVTQGFHLIRWQTSVI
jgi:hypothetical protein